ncbi:hypothetical protein DFS34DRAFT_668191, partial [Phlyctochytrium arcticum]
CKCHNHKQKIILVTCTKKSQEITHYALLDFNHRWNLNMAIRNRGLSKEIGGHSAQYLCDELQQQISSFSDITLFPDWPIIYLYHDTGERSGLKTCMKDCLRILENNQLQELTDDFAEELAESEAVGAMTVAPMNDTVILLRKLTQLARFFAQELIGCEMVFPVKTDAGKQKFSAEHSRFLQSANPSSMSGERQKKSFCLWVKHWNATLGPDIGPKTERHLDLYYAQWKERSNARETMAPIREPDGDLRLSLREAHEGAMPVATPVPVPCSIPGSLTQSHEEDDGFS